MASSLVVVGSGIKYISHLTHEARAYIEQSDKVLYLVNDPAMKDWICQANPNSETLDELYSKHTLRQDCYTAITEFILSSLRKNQHICVVLYGHPCIFAQPALDAVIQAKLEGYYAKILPAISAADCLFADLLIDPGEYGCQSYEATDLLIYERKISPTSYLLIWQIDVIGVFDNPRTGVNVEGIKFLIKYLGQYYDSEHEVIIYEAAQYPSFDPIIQKCSLKELAKANISRISTLCIPPMYKPQINKKILKELSINMNSSIIK